MTGCASAPPGNPEPENSRTRLEAAFDAVAAGHTPTRRPVSAGERGRWEDVDLALYWAVAEPGVEMAIVGRIETETGWQYTLKTVEGWPVIFEVDRAPGERIYERSAAVGRFPDLPQRRERARFLEDMFDRFMADLGKKRRLPPQDALVP